MSVDSSLNERTSRKIIQYLISHGMKITCNCLFLFFMVLTDASRAQSTDDQVKDLMRRYEEVEGQLDRSVRYAGKTESDGATTVEQAWYNGAGDLIKVATERTDSSGRELTEYFERDFANYKEPTFILVRKETRLPDGGIQVDESRRYFDFDGSLVRELRKSARFKANESTDTQRVPNVVVDVKTEQENNRGEEERSNHSEIVLRLIKAGPPVFDPFKKVKGDSARFRVIQESASPDGRYAIAIGLARKKIDWDKFGKEELESEDDVRNYVVDLVQQRILGETGCNYFATFPRSGRNACQVIWSPDSTKFAFHQWSGKWSDICLVGGQIAAGPKFIGVADLQKEIQKKTFSFLKKPRDSADLWWDIDQVSNDGVVQMRVDCVGARGSEREGETSFSLSERLRLRATPKGLRAEIVNIRSLPAEHEPD